MLKITKITKIVTLSTALIFSANTFAAITPGSSSSPVGPFPLSYEEIYAPEVVNVLKNPNGFEAIPCDVNVLNKQIAKANKTHQFEKKQDRVYLVEKQVLATPKNNTKRQLHCIDGALSAINSIANAIDDLLGLLTGRINWNGIGESIFDKIMEMACHQIDSYLTGQINDINSELNINDFHSTISSYKNTKIGVNTPGGTIGGSINDIYKNTGTNPTPVGDTIKGLTK